MLALALTVLLAQLPSAAADGDRALVVVSRHSGEVLVTRGACDASLPVGSALEPFLAAGGPAPAPFGPFAAVLEAAGLSGKAAPAMSPAGLARALRILAELRPEIVKSGAGDGTARFRGAATLAGPTRGASTRSVAWLVDITPDVVVVMAGPEASSEAFATALTKARALPATAAARVQAFALARPGEVEVRCPKGGFFGVDGVPRAFDRSFAKLEALAQRGPVLCLEGPLYARVPGLARGGREYAGVFERLSPPPPYRAREGVKVTEREQRARTGSSFVFRTTKQRYAAGVVEAEDAEIEGEARKALLEVVAHNAEHSRHDDRPVCDTTHCQAFKGTVRPRPGDAEAVSSAPPEAVAKAGWLLFSRGGAEPWSETRARAQVEAATGPGASELRFAEGKVRYALPARPAGAELEGAVAQCEPLRAALRLPACPETAARRGDAFVFRGHGRGHGEGLDVEWAKRSGLNARQLLEQAYARER